MSVDQSIVVKVLMSCPALFSLSLGYHFDNLELKSLTRSEYLICCLLIPESKSMSFRKRTQTAPDFDFVICKDMSRNIFGYLQLFHLQKLSLIYNKKH